MHEYAKNKKWGVLVQEARKNRELLNVRNEYFQTAFHEAVRNGAPSETIVALIKLKPNVLAQKNDEGMIPLHLGCEYGMSIDTLLAFLKYAPDSIHWVSKNNRTPLEIARGSAIFGRCTWHLYREDYSKVLAALENPQVLEAVQSAQEATAIKHRAEAYIGIPTDPDLRAMTDESGWA